jgi:hypothetical protein
MAILPASFWALAMYHDSFENGRRLTWTTSFPRCKEKSTKRMAKQAEFHPVAQHELQNQPKPSAVVVDQLKQTSPPARVKAVQTRPRACD